MAVVLIDGGSLMSCARPVPSLSAYRAWLAAERGLAFFDYESLRRWSVEDLDAFWRSIWDYSAVVSPDTPTLALAEDRMPGAVWFPGARVSYVRQVMSHVEAAHAVGQPAIIAEDEQGQVETVSWPELRERVASLARRLRALGVVRGDRVAALLPNRAEAVVAFLACAAIGAIWTVCAPDMGVPAIRDRFTQIAPKVLVATDGAYYAGRWRDLTATVGQLQDALPSVAHLLLVATQPGAAEAVGALDFAEACSDPGVALEADWLPFDTPLWILFSSGTTGLPKALVHGHGGILLGAAAASLHSGLGASYAPETFEQRFHWYSSTGWMMWNAQVNGLLSGTTICIFDGSPFGAAAAPDLALLWRFAARHRVTFFGSGAAFFSSCRKAGFDPSTAGDLGALNVLGSTASPLPAEVQSWLSERLPGVWWCNISGGTDICGSFLTGNREMALAPGRLQCRQVGAAIEAWDADGRPVLGRVGELVCVRPMPNMPLYLWNDAEGLRYQASYFDHFPSVWRHGDWIKIDPDGSCEIFGRSDATINRAGHRVGTSEIYSAVEVVDGVADSLAIDVDLGQGQSRILLFVQTADGVILDETLRRAVKDAVRGSLSPRFTPDEVIGVRAIPRTLSSKKQELPIKRLFQGASLEEVVDPSAMANPEALAEYVTQAERFRRCHGDTRES